MVKTLFCSGALVALLVALPGRAEATTYEVGPGKTYANIGADQLTFGMLSSNLPIEFALEATETFGREVLPRFDLDPVHRTTRQREANVGARA